MYMCVVVIDFHMLSFCHYCNKQNLTSFVLILIVWFCWSCESTYSTDDWNSKKSLEDWIMLCWYMKHSWVNSTNFPIKNNLVWFRQANPCLYQLSKSWYWVNHWSTREIGLYVDIYFLNFNNSLVPIFINL